MRALGRHRAAAILLLGEPLDAAAAEAAGLVARVVPSGELRAAAGEVAGRLAAGPTRAIGLAKRLINRAEDLGLDESLAAEAALQDVAGGTADHAEGIAAFAEKREPRFEGR